MLYSLLNRKARTTDRDLVSTFVDQSTGLAHQIVDIACHVKELAHRITAKQLNVSEVQEGAVLLQEQTAAIVASVAQGTVAARQTHDDIQRSTLSVRDSLAAISDLVQTETEGSELISSFGGTLERVGSFAESIESIAEQTHLLALEAASRATCAGAADCGFAAVARQIATLAAKTAEATKNIMNTVADLNQKTERLLLQGAKSTQTGRSAENSTSTILERLGAIERSVGQFQDVMARIEGSAKSAQFKNAFMGEAVASLSRNFLGAALLFEQIENTIDQVRSVSEDLLMTTLATDLKTPHTKFVKEAIRLASIVSATLSSAIESGQLSIYQVFDTDYIPILGSNPPQFETSYCKLFDQVLQPLFDKALDFDARVVYCTAVDENGFLPTHNSKFSKPQGQDAIWNAAHCRNRRFFKDRVGLGAARNEEAFLLQTYCRDMGGGRFVPMADVTAPIHVRGRHWGGLRLAYTLNLTSQASAEPFSER